MKLALISDKLNMALDRCTDPEFAEVIGNDDTVNGIELYLILEHKYDENLFDPACVWDPIAYKFHLMCFGSEKKDIDGAGYDRVKDALHAIQYMVDDDNYTGAQEVYKRYNTEYKKYKLFINVLSFKADNYFYTSDYFTSEERDLADTDLHLDDEYHYQVERWFTGSDSSHQYPDNAQWVTGDFTGDGAGEVAKAFPSSGNVNMDVHSSDGLYLDQQRWVTDRSFFPTNSVWVSGDFNNDGNTDIADAFPWSSNANVFVHPSTGTTFSSAEVWSGAASTFYSGSSWLSGNFNGDSYDDMIQIYNNSGYTAMIVYESNGSNFTVDTAWGPSGSQGYYPTSSTWFTGDFNNDSKCDVAKVWSFYGYAYIDVHISNGSTFTSQRWSSAQITFPASSQWVSGDFNGDGKTDIARIDQNSGNFRIVTLYANSGSNGFDIVNTDCGPKPYVSGTIFKAVDLHKDGRDEIINIFEDGSGYTTIDAYSVTELWYKVIEE